MSVVLATVGSPRSGEAWSACGSTGRKPLVAPAARRFSSVCAGAAVPKRQPPSHPWQLLGVAPAASPVETPNPSPESPIRRRAAGRAGRVRRSRSRSSSWAFPIWAGAEPGPVFDCSGLVMFVYRQLGISLPNFSGSQWYARRVPLDRLARAILSSSTCTPTVRAPSGFTLAGKFISAANRFLRPDLEPLRSRPRTPVRRSSPALLMLYHEESARSSGRPPPLRPVRRRQWDRQMKTFAREFRWCGWTPRLCRSPFPSAFSDADSVIACSRARLEQAAVVGNRWAARCAGCCPHRPRACVGARPVDADTRCWNAHRRSRKHEREEALLEAVDLDGAVT